VSEWRTVKINDVGLIGRGVSYNGTGLNQPGPILVGMGQVQPDGRLNLSDARTYGGKVKPEHFLGEDDVAIVMTDLTQSGQLLGSPARAPSALIGKLIVSHHLQRLHCGPSLEPQFAQYLLMGPDWKSHVQGMATGTTVRAVSPDDALRFEFRLPPLIEQRAIAGVLGALDDKIESNRRMADLLGRLIPLVFQAGIGKFEYRNLPDVATVHKGVSYRSVDLQDSDTAMMTLKSFDRNGGYKSDGLKSYVGVHKPTQVLQPGEIVVAQTDLTQGAEVVGRAVVVPRQSRYQTLIASLDLLIVRPIEPDDRWFLYGALIQEDFREHCRSRTSGTTVLHLGSDALPTYQLPWADQDVRRAIADEIESLVLMNQSLDQESEKLSALRDALLPELLSGRLRVRDAEKVVEEVV
jgi:type I restriction enzyme S subunit